MRDLIIHLGVSGFPRGNAEMQRIKMTFMSLMRSGAKVLVFSKISIHSDVVSSRYISRSDGVPFIRTSLIKSRPRGLFVRLLNRLSGLFCETFVILKKRNRIQTALVYTPLFYELVYYRLLSRIVGFELSLVYVEYRSSIKHRNNFFDRLNDYFFDNFCTSFCDSALPISQFLSKKLFESKRSLPIFVMPAITDFRQFELVPAYEGSEYLCFCGSISYIDIILFVIELYESLKASSKFFGKLLLVVSGKSDNWNILKQKLSSSEFGSDIDLVSNISYTQLISYYKGASALIIPLRQTVQDIARFPHKISEYTASGRPIISTRIGDVAHYFKHESSAILADSFAIDSFLGAIGDSLLSKDKLDAIGEGGREVGLRFFNSRSYDLQLRDFLFKTDL